MSTATAATVAGVPDDFPTSPDVDSYIAGSTQWRDEMTALRRVVLASGLTEQLKWRKPCYSHEGKNVVIMQEMKDFLALMFFKGALLDDSAGVLHDQGPNSRSARRMQFTSVDDVTRRADVLAAYLDEAIDVEVAGLEVAPAPEPEWVDELTARLDLDAELAAGFESLTPGRRREYNLHFASAKQAATREARIDRARDRIVAGKGLRDR